MKRNGRLKIHWVTQVHNLVANALGYNTHNKFMRKYCSQIMDFDDTAPVALNITPADQYFTVPGKFNILFSMWEFTDLPDTYVEGINKADAVIVPSRFCKDLFQRYTKKPVEVCWEGVEPEKFPFYERKFPDFKKGERFRFLWVGAPNPRKGYPLILEACKLIEQVPQLEMYIKTTMPDINWIKTIKSTWKYRKYIFRDFYNIKRWGSALIRSIRRIPKPIYRNTVKVLGKHKNIIFDTRVLPFDELVKLYHSAHCFLLPTLGEGWGLTLCEAMATGCPSIATQITGCADFFNDNVGYPIDYELKEKYISNYKVHTKIFVPDTEDLIKKMIYVFKHYKEALKKGKAASTRIHNKFTWELSAKRLDSIIRGFINAN